MDGIDHKLGDSRIHCVQGYSSGVINLEASNNDQLHHYYTLIREKVFNEPQKTPPPTKPSKSSPFKKKLSYIFNEILNNIKNSNAGEKSVDKNNKAG